ncbi:hypothetical protein AB6D11_01000 [Vibrio splendidus]
MNATPIIEFNQFDLIRWVEDVTASRTSDAIMSVLQRVHAMPMDTRFDDVIKTRIIALMDALHPWQESHRLKQACPHELNALYGELLDVQESLLDHFNPTVGDVCAMVDALKEQLSHHGRTDEIKPCQLAASQRLFSTLWRVTKQPGPIPQLVSKREIDPQDRPTVTIKELNDLSSRSERVLVVGASLMGESIRHSVSERIQQAHDESRRLQVSIQGFIILCHNLLPRPMLSLSVVSKYRLNLIVDLGSGFQKWFQSTVSSFFLPGGVAGMPPKLEHHYLSR